MDAKDIKNMNETVEDNMKEDSNYSCYVLRPIKHRQKSYCGVTNNLKNRLDQHNKVKKGGAKSTLAGGPWEFYVVIQGFQSYGEVLSFEYLMKHPTREKKRPKEYTGVSGRVKALNLVMSLDRWSDRTEGLQKALEEGREYVVYLDKIYMKSIDRTKIKENVLIKDISELKY
jgi:predicted GIY-YIG superfamily endonuclease